MCSPTARSLFGGPDGNPSGRREQEQAPSNGIIANAADRLGIDRLTDDEIDAKDPLSLLDENIESCGTKTVDCPRQGCVTYFNVDDQTWHMVRTTCGTWSCQYCGRVKRARMLEKVQAARPNRFVTLTTIGDAKKTPREVYDWSRRQISELSKSYRRDGIEFEYLRVLEVTKKGFPQYHLLVRSPYLDKRELSHRWCHFTEAFIVDIRALSPDEKGARYVMKYLGKQDSVPFTNRRVSWTRNFFPKEETEPKPKQCLAEVKRWGGSPEHVLYWEYSAADVEKLNQWHWIIKGKSWQKQQPPTQKSPDSESSSPDSGSSLKDSQTRSEKRTQLWTQTRWSDAEPQ